MVPYLFRGVGLEQLGVQIDLPRHNLPRHSRPFGMWHSSTKWASKKGICLCYARSCDDAVQTLSSQRPSHSHGHILTTPSDRSVAMTVLSDMKDFHVESVQTLVVKLPRTCLNLTYSEQTSTYIYGL